jgi:hypothetical protein
MYLRHGNDLSSDGKIIPAGLALVLFDRGVSQWVANGTFVLARLVIFFVVEWTILVIFVWWNGLDRWSQADRVVHPAARAIAGHVQDPGNLWEAVRAHGNDIYMCWVASLACMSGKNVPIVVLPNNPLLSAITLFSDSTIFVVLRRLLLSEIGDK